MTPDKIDIEGTIDSFFRRCMAARAAGGIPQFEVLEGKAIVPEGWKLEPLTQYFLPANISLL